MPSRRAKAVIHMPRRLSFTDAAISLRLFLGNATLQSERLANPDVSREEIDTLIKALQLAQSGIELTIPLLRAKRRELLRSANG